MAPNVQRILEIPKLVLGEGPHWDVNTQTLYLVDISGKSVHKYVPSTGKHSMATFDKPISVIIPVKDQPDKFVVTLERDICIITWDGRSEKVQSIEKIAEADKGTKNRINDGKCDVKGRLWAGSMGPELKTGHFLPELGSLFSLTKTNLVTHVSKISLSNGLAWNHQNDKMYYIDSLSLSVFEFDYDETTGTITNRKPIFTLPKHGIDGLPDGMTIDVDGNLWVAVYNSYHVYKIDPRKPETLLESVEIPAKQVTSVAWGGPDLDTLYVTTGSFTVDGVELNEPVHGATYKISGLGTKGLPANDFVL